MLSSICLLLSCNLKRDIALSNNEKFNKNIALSSNEELNKKLIEEVMPLRNPKSSYDFEIESKIKFNPSKEDFSKLESYTSDRKLEIKKVKEKGIDKVIITEKPYANGYKNSPLLKIEKKDDIKEFEDVIISKNTRYNKEWEIIVDENLKNKITVSISISSGYVFLYVEYKGWSYSSSYAVNLDDFRNKISE